MKLEPVLEKVIHFRRLFRRHGFDPHCGKELGELLTVTNAGEGAVTEVGDFGGFPALEDRLATGFLEDFEFFVTDRHDTYF